MSPPQTCSAEARLCLAYREQAGCYAQALLAVEALPQLFHQGQDAAQQLHALAVQLDHIAAIETRLAATKVEWHQSGRRPGTELTTVLDQVAELIERLAQQIHAAEQEALSQKSGLLSQLDEATRGHQMHRAYRQIQNAFIPQGDG